MNQDEYYPGKGCTCAAHSSSECGCTGVDWTDPEVYRLREQLAEAQNQLGQAREDLKQTKIAHEAAMASMRGQRDEWKRAAEYAQQGCRELIAEEKEKLDETQRELKQWREVARRLADASLEMFKTGEPSDAFAAATCDFHKLNTPKA